MSYSQMPRNPSPNPKRTLTKQLYALRNTAMCLSAVFLILFCTFVFLLVSINKVSAKNNTATTTTTKAETTTTPTAQEGEGSSVEQTTTTEATTAATTAAQPKTTYPEGTKLIALTFDDGPSKFTPEVLDTLKAEGIPATFFMIGQCVEGTDASVLQRMLDQGCEIGNHTWSHATLTKVDEEGAYEQLKKCDDVIMSKIGVKSTVIRPPTGAGAKQPGLFKYARENKQFIVNWNDSSCPSDWQKPANGDADYTAKYVIDNAIAGDCVLLHDVHESTVKSLPAMIKGLKEKGFTFVTVSELLEAQTQLGVEQAKAAGWSDTEAFAGENGGVIGVRYVYSSNKIYIEKKLYS
ncbi:MAG: polysaccharide deacetylase family protein [Clostridiales bacterium]|nr:polysaccharide deacetylase family protein [Clostridiales bacterium]